MNHKYSTAVLWVFFIVFVIGIAGANLISGDIDELCATDGSILQRINGEWQCAGGGGCVETEQFFTISTVTPTSNGYWNYEGVAMRGYRGLRMPYNATLTYAYLSSTTITGNCSDPDGNRGQLQVNNVTILDLFLVGTYHNESSLNINITLGDEVNVFTPNYICDVETSPSTNAIYQITMRRRCS